MIRIVVQLRINTCKLDSNMFKSINHFPILVIFLTSSITFKQSPAGVIPTVSSTFVPVL